MVVNIAIKGGLGNQLFQYALGSFLKQKYNCVVRYDILPLDAAEKNLTPRSFLLDRLFTDIAYTSQKEHNFFYTTNDSPQLKLYKKIYRTLNRYSYMAEGGMAEPELKSGGTYYLEGYWQSARNAGYITTKLNDCTGQVLKNNPYLTRINASPESVAIHIRRGDYVQNPFISSYHGSCDLNYFLRAMQLIETKVNVSSYFIFSDDIAWARENIKSTYPVTFVAGDTEEPFADLFLMKSCRHQVISNSSFSCWASYLNNHAGKIVIAPVNWTKKEKTIEMPLFEDIWILI